MFELLYCITYKAIEDTEAWRITQLAKAAKEFFRWKNNMTITRYDPPAGVAFAFKISGPVAEVQTLASLFSNISEKEQNMKNPNIVLDEVLLNRRDPGIKFTYNLYWVEDSENFSLIYKDKDLAEKAFKQRSEIDTVTMVSLWRSYPADERIEYYRSEEHAGDGREE